MASETAGNLKRSKSERTVAPIWILWSVLLGATILLLFMDLDLANTEGKVIGRVETKEGNTDGRSGDLSLWRSLPKNTEVRDGGWIRTGGSSGVVIKLLSGSSLYISEESQVMISLRDQTADSELVLGLERGQIAFKNGSQSSSSKNRVVVTATTGLMTFDHITSLIQVVSNLDGRLSPFTSKEIDWTGRALGQRFLHDTSGNLQQFEPEPIAIEAKIEVNNPGLLGEDLSVASMNLRLKPFDFSKNKWYLEPLEELSKDEMIYSIENFNKLKNPGRQAVIASKIKTSSNPIIVKKADFGASQIRVSFGKLFEGLERISTATFAGYDPNIVGGLFEASTQKAIFSPEVSSYQFRSIGDAQFPLGIEFDRLTIKPFISHNSMLAVPFTSRRNLGYDLCIYSQPNLLSVGRHIQNASQVGIYGCDRRSVAQGTFFVRGGSIIVSSQKQIDPRGVNTLRSDLNADLAYIGSQAALIPSQDRKKALAKVLRREKDAGEIYFLRGNSLVAVNQAFLSKNTEVVTFVLQNSAALFRNRVEIVSVK